MTNDFIASIQKRHAIKRILGHRHRAKPIGHIPAHAMVQNGPETSNGSSLWHCGLRAAEGLWLLKRVSALVRMFIIKDLRIILKCRPVRVFATDFRQFFAVWRMENAPLPDGPPGATARNG